MKNHYLVTCAYCGKKVWRENKQRSKLKYYPNRVREYCSSKCAGLYRYKRKTVKCGWCSKEIIKAQSELKRSKSGEGFCNHSCAARYANAHKTKGTRRSKLEKWLEIKLLEKYKHLNPLFNDKQAINSELDIFIPSLRLAFELNGIFHYEPIFGQEKLSDIQHNDKQKFMLCQMYNIELCVIDSSTFKYFKEKNAQKFLDIIVSIIDTRISN